MWIWRVLH